MVVRGRLRAVVIGTLRWTREERSRLEDATAALIIPSLETRTVVAEGLALGATTKDDAIKQFATFLDAPRERR